MNLVESKTKVICLDEEPVACPLCGERYDVENAGQDLWLLHAHAALNARIGMGWVEAATMPICPWDGTLLEPPILQMMRLPTQVDTA